ncbi:hypothetical protein [Bacillus kexueae]|nr:hypothetical protein [Bacillus kexueae]
MGWVFIIIIAYIPIFYRIHKRLNLLEDEVRSLRAQIQKQDNY